MNTFERAALNAIINSLQGGGKVLICGNGGSASQAQHFAAELVGRFQAERAALPAIALTADPAVLSAIGNDYGYEHIFSRQIEALAMPGDIVIVLTTSGESKNVLRAIQAAHAEGAETVGLTGDYGGHLAHDPAYRPTYLVRVPGHMSFEIQQNHLAILHEWAGLIEHWAIHGEGK